jgi:hypothetical protein
MGTVKFNSNIFDDDPDELLAAAARLTLRLSQRCWWVEGCEDLDCDDPDSWDGLYDRIWDLMGAFTYSREGVGQDPTFLMALFASRVANVIANVPSIRAAVAADLASKQDNDP